MITKKRCLFIYTNHQEWIIGAIFNEIDSITPIISIGRHNIIPYDRYCRFLAGCSGMVLNIQNGPGSSDISGNTVVLEALCAQKPVFINQQHWLKNVPTKNIHIYKDLKDKKRLLLERLNIMMESRCSNSTSVCSSQDE